MAKSPDPIRISFAQGIQEPAKLGTVILKLGDISYAQNIDVQNDEYGRGVAVPGPALVTIANNAELTGVPFVSALYSVEGQNDLYFAEGLLGAVNVVRRIENVVSGSTPEVGNDAADELVATHSGHANVTITDMVIRDVAGTSHVYWAGKDDTDLFVQYHLSNVDTIAITATQVLTGSLGVEPKLCVGADNAIYIGHGRHIDIIDTGETYDNDVIVLRNDLGVTAMASWKLNLAVAFNTASGFDFSQRKSGGQAGIVYWDYTLNGSWTSDYLLCPSRYISALVQTPGGNLLAFGGVDEGKCTIWEFTGYGFNKIVSYIGDLPRSRHSVDFDGQGRLMWITADGQICRYTFGSAEIEHLGTIATGSSAGGLFRRLVGGTGNEFVAASGTGSTYTTKRVVFGSYLGDGDAGSDGVTTPLVISGLRHLPPGSTITAITLHLNKDLATSENIELRLYKNGNTTASVYMSMEFSADEAISSKRKAIPVRDVHNFALGIAWKQTDALATAPPVVFADVEYETTIN